MIISHLQDGVAQLLTRKERKDHEGFYYFKISAFSAFSAFL
jgi:hypothetical protein